MRVVIAKVINYSSNAKILKNKLQVKKNYKLQTWSTKVLLYLPDSYYVCVLCTDVFSEDFNAIIQLFCRHNILEIYTTTGLSYFLWLAILYFLFFFNVFGRTTISRTRFQQKLIKIKIWIFFSSSRLIRNLSRTKSNCIH